MEAESATLSATPGPVAAGERVDSLDVLRGFALLGILVMNIQAFSMPFVAYINPTSYGDLTGANYRVWFASHVFFDQKFMTIFSMLFGAGIVLFTQRAEAQGARAVRLHYRRTMWLLLIGLLHAYLLWWGDILVLYAQCALIVVWMRRLSPRALIAIGVPVIAVTSAVMLAAGFSLPYWPPEEAAELKNDGWRPTQEKLKEELAAYRGSWSGQLSHRVPHSLEFQTFGALFWGLWRAGGLMLIGMALFKSGVLSAERPARFYLGMGLGGAVLGLPLILYGVHRNQAAGWDVSYSFFFGPQFNYWGSLLLSASYVGFLLLACQTGAAPWLLRPLRAVGQMAFTNYLMHTLICITIFYGPGLGLFGSVSRVGQLLTVLGVWAAQLIYSPIWLRHFRFGPFEWLWRSLTYWSWQPLRRPSAASP